MTLRFSLHWFYYATFSLDIFLNEILLALEISNSFVQLCSFVSLVHFSGSRIKSPGKIPPTKIPSKKNKNKKNIFFSFVFL